MITPPDTRFHPRLALLRISHRFRASFSRLKRSIDDHAVIIVPALIFFALVLAINWELFVTPITEYGDTAANSIQVVNAKHLRELLGNYSRWRFHHPGPGFFYLFALGEAVLHDFLHLVPAPTNAQTLTAAAFSTTCLFLTIYIFYVNVRRPLFPALAVFVSILFLYVLETSIPASAIVSVWPPYMSIFTFLLMAASSASVGAGKWSHLPLLTFSGMMMIHAHVAQILFVSVVAGSGLGIALVGALRSRDLAHVLRTYKLHFVISLIIFLVFAFPIGLDWAIHSPNNIDQVRAYLHTHHGEHNSLKTTILYVFSFFTYFVTPETTLAKPSVEFGDILTTATFIRAYWSIFLFLGMFGLGLFWGSHRKLPLFLKIVFAEIGILLALFCYWSREIAGGMYTFNGFFFFSVQLLALLAFGSLISGMFLPVLARRTQIALAGALTAPVLLVAGLRNGYSPFPEIPAVVALLEAKHVKGYAFEMQPQSWDLTAGVASYLDRDKIPFCVDPEWQFIYGREHTCQNARGFYRVSFSTTKPACNAPCSSIYDSAKLHVTGAPDPAFLHIPAMITPIDCTHESSGFSGSWTTAESSLRFYVSGDGNTSIPFELIVTGTMLPGRPATVNFNGRALGMISTAGESTQTFPVDPHLIAWNGADTLTFSVPNAAPVGSDPRTLGYFFQQLVLCPMPRAKTRQQR